MNHTALNELPSDLKTKLYRKIAETYLGKKESASYILYLESAAENEKKIDTKLQKQLEELTKLIVDDLNPTR